MVSAKHQGQGTVGHRLRSVLSRLKRGAISSDFVGRGRGEVDPRNFAQHGEFISSFALSRLYEKIVKP